MNPRHLVAATMIGLGLIGLAGLTGCAAAGAVVSKLSGPGTVPARYKPLPHTMVVLVERADNPSAGELEAHELERQLWLKLKHYNIAPLVEPAELNKLRVQRADFRTMAIGDIGMAVGARQALYVDLRAVEINVQASGHARGQAALLIKVVDCVTREARFPTEYAEGYPLSVVVEWKRVDGANPEDSLRRDLIDRAAADVVGLFRDREATGTDASR